MCSVRYFGKRFLYFRCPFARRQRLITGLFTGGHVHVTTHQYCQVGLAVGPLLQASPDILCDVPVVASVTRSQ